jgi:hypothetical protein
MRLTKTAVSRCSISLLISVIARGMRSGGGIGEAYPSGRSSERDRRLFAGHARINHGLEQQRDTTDRNIIFGRDDGVLTIDRQRRKWWSQAPPIVQNNSINYYGYK